MHDRNGMHSFSNELQILFFMQPYINNKSKYICSALIRKIRARLKYLILISIFHGKINSYCSARKHLVRWRKDFQNMIEIKTFHTMPVVHFRKEDISAYFIGIFENGTKPLAGIHVQSHFENDRMLALARPFTITAIEGKFLRITKVHLCLKIVDHPLFGRINDISFLHFYMFTRHYFQVVQCSKMCSQKKGCFV